MRSDDDDASHSPQTIECIMLKSIFFFVSFITVLLVVCAAEVDKLGKVMKQAKAADVHVVDEEFLNDVGKSPAAVTQLIVQHSIATWGSDVS